MQSLFMLNPSNPLRSLLLAILAVLVAGNDAVSAGKQPTVEVLTVSGLPIATDLKGDRVQVYEIDGINRFEEELSRGLPASAATARRAALERVGQLDEGQMQRVQRAAMGLSKAMQYGIDRYPAMVFDGQAVVYGVTDVTEALHRYRRWQEASGQ